MSENNSKFPKFFIYMFSALLIVMLICTMFSASAVGTVYFVMLLLVIVFILLDKKYGFFITNYRPIFIMFDLSTFIGSLAVVCYEYVNHTLTLNILLIILISLSGLLVLYDALALKNKNKYLNKFECLAIDFLQICSMICMLTYFYRVSTFWYLVFALAAAVANMALKIYFTIKLKRQKPEKVEVKENSISNETLNKLEQNSEDGEIE